MSTNPQRVKTARAKTARAKTARSKTARGERSKESNKTPTIAGQILAPSASAKINKYSTASLDDSQTNGSETDTVANKCAKNEDSKAALVSDNKIKNSDLTRATVNKDNITQADVAKSSDEDVDSSDLDLSDLSDSDDDDSNVFTIRTTCLYFSLYTHQCFTALIVVLVITFKKV